MELALEALRDDDAAHLAIKVAKDVVKVGAIGVTGNGGRNALIVLRRVDGSTAAVGGNVLRGVLET
jgi:hypothetical protein